MAGHGKFFAFLPTLDFPLVPFFHFMLNGPRNKGLLEVYKIKGTPRYKPQLYYYHENLERSASDVKWDDYQSHLKRSLFLVFHHFPSKTLDKSMAACAKEQP